jgi:hypothetical protein
MAEESEIGLRQKLRDDFVSGGPDAHTDEALLELLLSYALSIGNPEPLARKLILEFGGLDNVLSSDFDTLCKINVNLNPLRTLATDQYSVILLLPGRRAGDKIIMFSESGEDSYLLPTNLIADDHIWSLNERA